LSQKLKRGGGTTGGGREERGKARFQTSKQSGCARRAQVGKQKRGDSRIGKRRNGQNFRTNILTQTNVGWGVVGTRRKSKVSKKT